MWKNNLICICMSVLSLSLCPDLCDRGDCSSPSSSVQGIFQARILLSVAISDSKGASSPRNLTCLSCIGFTTAPPRKPHLHLSSSNLYPPTHSRQADLGEKKSCVMGAVHTRQHQHKVSSLLQPLLCSDCSSPGQKKSVLGDRTGCRRCWTVVVLPVPLANHLVSEMCVELYLLPWTECRAHVLLWRVSTLSMCSWAVIYFFYTLNIKLKPTSVIWKDKGQFL